ncbi:MAG: hypothetical protein HY958_01840 [Bacteroidia bacterium]|nr:hypothetical protein [Bacteroidia bacterium]
MMRIFFSYIEFKKTGKFFLVVFFMIHLHTGFLFSQTRVDTSKYQSLIKEKIKKISVSKRNVAWMIAGTNSDSVYRVTKNMKAADKTGRIRTHTSSVFTSILSLRKNLAFIGTKNDYSYFSRRFRVLKLDSKHGVTDSCIQAIYYSRLLNKVIIKTATSSFVSTDRYFKKYKKNGSIGTIIPNPGDTIMVNEYDEDAEPFMEVNEYLDDIRRPFQSVICRIASSVDLSFRSKKLITKQQARKIRRILEPGDILLKRDNWQLVNLGIPGFWTHAGIYIGSLKELDRHFSGAKILKGEKPSAYIKKHYFAVWKKMKRHKFRIIEAIADGVKINKISHIARVDYFAALRPQLSNEDIFKAILQTFEYYQKPYDFLFDFESDDEILCSELIYKAYIPCADKAGLHFLMNDLNGSAFMFPTDIVRKFDAEKDNPDKELRLIIFYDASEKQKKSFVSDEVEFGNTWKRTTMDIIKK